MKRWRKRDLGRRRGRAFTLIELLVVIVTIALLIAILLPALGKARAIAIQAQVKSDYAGLMKMIHTYGGDNNTFGPTTTASGEQVEPAPVGYAGSGVGQMSKWHTSTAIPTYLIWDSRINVSSLFGAGVGVRIGLGTLIDGYMSPDMGPFFHPRMRGQTQTDAGGTARRHWYHAGISKDWGKTSVDVCGTGNTVWSPQSNNVPANASNNGTWIGSTILYRGGYFGTFNGSNVFNGTKDQIRFMNKRTDAIAYSKKPQLMSSLLDNQIRRSFGELIYALGDGSAQADSNANWMTSGTTATDFNTAGTNPAWLTPPNTPPYLLDHNDNLVGSGSTALNFANGVRFAYQFWRLDTVLGCPGQ